MNTKSTPEAQSLKQKAIQVPRSVKMNISTLKLLNTPEPQSANLVTMRFTENPTPTCLFSDVFERVSLHYLDTPEQRGYFHCNGDDCVLCKADNKAFDRILIPGYNIMSGQVEVISISDSMTPTALLPQILVALDSEDLVINMITRKFNKYTVEVRPAHPSINMGRAKIEAFNTAFDDDVIRLESVYPTCSNEEFTAIPSINTMLVINGHLQAI